MGVKMAWWTTWRASSRPGVTAGSPWLWRAFSHSYGSAGVRRPPRHGWLLGAGAAVLAATGQYRWIAVWICFGVGVHFFPLASTLDNRSLRLLGVLLVAVAVAVAAAALAAGLASAAAPSTVTGAGAGVVPPRLRHRYLPDRKGTCRRKRAS
jgi:hypothetical protein